MKKIVFALTTLFIINISNIAFPYTDKNSKNYYTCIGNGSVEKTNRYPVRQYVWKALLRIDEKENTLQVDYYLTWDAMEYTNSSFSGSYSQGNGIIFNDGFGNKLQAVSVQSKKVILLDITISDQYSNKVLHFSASCFK